MDAKPKRSPEEEVEWLKFLVRKKNERIKRIQRQGRHEAEQKIRTFVHTIVEGAFKEYVHAHGNSPVETAKFSIFKRVVGQFCSMDRRRIFVRLIMDVEREIYHEVEALMEENEEQESPHKPPGLLVGLWKRIKMPWKKKS